MAVIYKAGSEPPLSQAWLGGCLYPLPCLEQRPPRGPGFEAVPMGTSWLCTLCDPLALGQVHFRSSLLRMRWVLSLPWFSLQSRSHFTGRGIHVLEKHFITEKKKKVRRTHTQLSKTGDSGEWSAGCVSSQLWCDPTVTGGIDRPWGDPGRWAHQTALLYFLPRHANLQLSQRV